MALQPVLNNWKQRLDAIQNPSLEALRQALEQTTQEMADALGMSVDNLKIIAYFLDEIQLNGLHAQIVADQVEAGANENAAGIEAARRIRDEISELLGGMNVNDANMLQDGGRRKKSKKSRRYTRRR
jgi:hypothetical protein